MPVFRGGRPECLPLPGGIELALETWDKMTIPIFGIDEIQMNLLISSQLSFLWEVLTYLGEDRFGEAHVSATLFREGGLK